MSSEHRTLGRLYPKGTDGKTLADTMTEHARQHEFQLQTNVATHGRFKALEDRMDKVEAKDEAIDDKLAEIAVGVGKVKGAMWAIGIVWTVLLAVGGVVLAVMK